MADYIIESIQYGIGEGAMANHPDESVIVAEIRVNAGDKSFYLSLSELFGIPQIYKTNESAYLLLINDNEEALEADPLDLGGYEEILSVTDDPLYPLYKLLIFLVRADWDDCEALKEKVLGHHLDVETIPPCDLEDEDAYNEAPAPMAQEQKDLLYKMRLALESDVDTPSIFHDLNREEFHSEKEQLKAVKAACVREDEYQHWKLDYINSELTKLSKIKFTVCSYSFAGSGQYEMVIPEVGMDAFRKWISDNAYASLDAQRNATVDDIILYISLHAADQRKKD